MVVKVEATGVARLVCRGGARQACGQCRRGDAAENFTS
jgi:hypothetical protein